MFLQPLVIRLHHFLCIIYTRNYIKMSCTLQEKKICGGLIFMLRIVQFLLLPSSFTAHAGRVIILVEPDPTLSLCVNTVKCNKILSEQRRRVLLHQLLL